MSGKDHGKKEHRSKSNYSKRDSLESEQPKRLGNDQSGQRKQTEYYLDEPAQRPPKK
jgi:hypothetical protein